MPGYPGQPAPHVMRGPSWTSRLFLTAVVALALPFAVRAQTCDGALERADGLYVQAEFDAAIALLTECMEGEAFSEAERARAYRLLGLSYIGKGQMAEARTAAEDLMALDPAYEPDPADDPPTWQQLVEEVEGEPAVSPDPPPVDTDRADPPPATATPLPASQPERRGLGALFVELHGSSSALVDEDEDAFSGGGGGFKLGFPLTPAFIAFGGLTAAPVEPEDDALAVVDYRLTMLDLGAQLNFGASRRSFVPYFTAAYTRQSLSVDIDGVDGWTGNAFTGGIGFMYFFTPPLSVGLGLDVTFGGLQSDDLGDVSTTAARLSLGLSWFPLR